MTKEYLVAYKAILDSPSLADLVVFNKTKQNNLTEIYLRTSKFHPELSYFGLLNKTEWGEWEVNGSLGKNKYGAIRGAIGKLIRTHGGI